MRRWVIALAALGVLAVVNYAIFERERLLERGRIVLLELAPVDPRSLLQGDYMALNYHVANALTSIASRDKIEDGLAVLALDDRGIGTYRRIDDGGTLAADEVRLRFRIRDGRVRIATNAWFFEEGRRAEFANARYGEFRVGPDGDALLARLRDATLNPLGEATAVAR